ncbi:MAG: transcription antitermination factor NusB [Gemmatimonadota bacterium]|jgi:N utilization substance protein B|nr:transcription antitermination factor NusB [Gemmatimonadota bacterium]MDQ8166344.1 transcription antitermination factor NusB [Gemmatimonadota bacterium]MDQ8171630.1 transcription antitermination factor NusB [Gemmatimonadota bacterium]
MTNMQDDAFWDTPVQEPLAPRAGRRTRGSRAATKVERVETRGRARALQALYAADLRDLTQLRKIATHVFDDLAVDPEERQFASRLVATVAEKGAAIDADLAQVTNNWRLDRLGAIERSVLRLAAAELDRNETPVKVVLQEAVHLAERYGTTRSARFVNGVLDAYARRLGLL